MEGACPGPPHRGPEAELRGWVGARSSVSDPAGHRGWGQPLFQVLPGHMSRGSADRCPRDLGRLAGPPVPVVKALGSLRGSCGKELAGQPSSTLLRGREEPASVHSDRNESPTPRLGLVGLRVRDPGRALWGTSGREARHRAASWEP